MFRIKSVLALAVLASVVGMAGNALAGQPAGKAPAGPALSIKLDKTTYSGEETVKITGTVPAGKPVFIEIASEKNVVVRRLDSKKDMETGKIPWIFYTSEDIPAFYTILTPKDKKELIDSFKAQKKDWSYSAALKDLGIDPSGLRAAAAKVERRNTSMIAVITGSRGALITDTLDEKGSIKVTLPLYKTRFVSPGALLKPVVEVRPDSTFEATLKLPKGIADGGYTVTAFTDKAAKAAANFTATLSAGTWYFERAGMSANIFGPFFLALVITMLGVLMGAGGGFILNPLLISIYGLPHTIVAGTVLPTVLFSQGSGIYNYSKINFISWKLGITMGIAMLAGGFIGPVLTQLISLSQYKSWFGIVLLILAGLMFWQTLPAQVAKNKQEQEILKHIKKLAEQKQCEPKKG